MDATLTPSPAPASALSTYSRFVQRLQRRYADDLPLLAPGVPTRATMDVTLSQLQARGSELGVCLRILRQLVMERLVHIDCDLQAPLSDVTRAVTELAELALDAASTHAQATLDAVHGAPLGPNGQRAQLWIIGMGKFGARELNVSSDIDLIYIYDQDGETAGTPDGRGRISNHE